MNEHNLQNAIRNALAGKCYLFRANVGTAWTGKITKMPNGDLLIKDPRPFSSGLPAGFSDVFGFVSVTITPEMVGQKFARFIAGEVKTKKGRTSDRQVSFLAAVERGGGHAEVLRSVDDAVNWVAGASK